MARLDKFTEPEIFRRFDAVLLAQLLLNFQPLELFLPMLGKISAHPKAFGGTGGSKTEAFVSSLPTYT